MRESRYCQRCGSTAYRLAPDDFVDCHGRRPERKYFCRNCERGYDEGDCCPWCGTFRNTEDKTEWHITRVIFRSYFILFFPGILCACAVFFANRVAPVSGGLWQQLIGILSKTLACVVVGYSLMFLFFGIIEILHRTAIERFVVACDEEPFIRLILSVIFCFVMALLLAFVVWVVQ